jgi:hypothetical protein
MVTNRLGLRCGVGALLLSALAICGAAPPQARIDTARVAAQATRTVLDFDVAPIAEGSTLALEFSLRPALKGARLVAPDGRARTLDPAADLRRLPAEQRQRPALGDLYILVPPLRHPAPGRWRLEIDHAPAGRAHAVPWQAVQAPRFALDFRLVGGAEPAVGVEQAVLLRALDFGYVIEPAPPLLRVQAAGADAAPTAMGDARRHRPALAQDPGTWVGTLTPRAAGEHVLTATVRFAHETLGTLERSATLRLAVQAARPGQREPLRAEVQPGAGGCWQAVAFTMDWQADRPGLHTLSVVLPAVTVIPVMANGTTEARAGERVTLRALLKADIARRLPPGEHATAQTVDVLRTTDDALLVRRDAAAALPFPIDAARFCR